jgi:peroxiredoxin
MTGAEATSEGVPPAGAAPGSVGRSGWRRCLVGVLVLAVAAPAGWYFGTKPLVGPPSGSQALMGEPAKGVGPRVGFEAPNFKLQDPTGKPIELRQFRGKAVLINFWATWCYPCRDEMPELEQFYREHREQGLVVLAVSIDNESSVKHIPEYLQEGSPAVGPYTFPVAVDSKQEVARAYKLMGVPSSFFLDRAGVVRAVQPGAMSRQTMVDRLRTVLPAA